MTRRSRIAQPLAVAVLLTAACVGSGRRPAPPVAADAPYDVLVFSKTAGFRHDAIPAGIQAIRDLGAANNFTVDRHRGRRPRSPPPTWPGTRRWSSSAPPATCSTPPSRPPSSPTSRGGGGYVGVHAAADTEYDWPFYGELVGAYFASHPAIQQATVRVEDRAHAATAHLGPTWTRTDELYNYRTNPRAHGPRAGHPGRVDLLRRRDGRRPPDHLVPDRQGGRSFYTGLGHTQESYAEPAFRALLLGGIRYAAGRAKADCRPETGYTALYNGSTDRLVAGRAGRVHQHRRHADLGRRAWACSGTARKRVPVVLAEARLAVRRRRQLRRLRRLPGLARPERRRSTTATRSRSTPPTRRTGPPARSTASSPPTSPPATPR